MAYSYFGEKDQVPEKSEVENILRTSAALWERIISHISEKFGPIKEEWVYSGKKWGYSLRLKSKKRAIVYLTPKEGYFVAGYAFGKKAVEEIMGGNFPEDLKTEVEQSPQYAEGRGVRLEVRSSEDAENIVKLAEIKMAH